MIKKRVTYVYCGQKFTVPELCRLSGLGAGTLRSRMIRANIKTGGIIPEKMLSVLHFRKKPVRAPRPEYPYRESSRSLERLAAIPGPTRYEMKYFPQAGETLNSFGKGEYSTVKSSIPLG